MFNKHDLSTSVSFPKFDQVTWFVGMSPGSFDPLCGRVGAMTFWSVLTRKHCARSVHFNPGTGADPAASHSRARRRALEASRTSNKSEISGATQNKQIKIKTKKLKKQNFIRSHGCGWPDDRFCGGSHRLSPRGVVAWYKLCKVYIFFLGRRGGGQSS